MVNTVMANQATAVPECRDVEDACGTDRCQDIKIESEIEQLVAGCDRLEYIANCDFWFLRERLEKEGMGAYVDEALYEYKRFMGLIARGHRGLGMCSALVDEVWHTHILFTAEYAAFSAEVAGSYIHHAPVTSRTQQKREEGGGGKGFFEIYEEVYGYPPSSIWQMKMPKGEAPTICMPS